MIGAFRQLSCPNRFMRLRDFQTFSALLMSVLFILSFTFWNIQEQKPPFYSFTIRIPMAYDPNFTDEEFQEFLKSGGTTSAITESDKRRSRLPNDDTFLFISLETAGKLAINNQVYGTLNNPDPLVEKLGEIFRGRKENGVFETGNNRVDKAVIVKARKSEKYGNLVKVIDAVKSAGADPIVLQIDDLSQ